jgi:PAS domain S-box-containing protein
MPMGRGAAERKQQMLDLAEAMSGVGSWRYDVATGAVEWSDEVYRIYGVTRDAFDPNYDAAVAFFHPDDQPIVAAHVARALETGNGYAFQLRLTRRDGQIRDVTCKTECELGPGGEVATLFGVFQDITEGQRALRRAQRNEARYRLLADNMADVVTRIGLDGSSSYISPAIEQLLGYRPSDMAGQSSLAFVHPDDRDLLVQAFNALATGESRKTLQHRAVHKDGSVLWVETSFQLVADEAGVAREAIAVIRDISQRRALEAALADSELRYRTLAEHSSDIMVRVAPDSTVRYISPACRKIGYEPEELVGQSLLKLVAPEQRDRATAMHKALFSGREVDPTVRREHQVVGKDGTVFWYEGNPRIVRDADGQPIEVVNVYRDVTARRGVEDALAESEFRYRTLAENSSDILVRFGRDGLVRHVSPSCRTLGVDPETAIGKPVIKLIAPDYAAQSEAIIAALFSGEEVDRSVRREHRVIGNNGAVMWLEGNPRLIRDETGQAVEIVTVLRDVTARRAVEDALAEAKRVAEASTEAKSQFLANMSHELRTPLTSIIGFSGLLNDLGDLPEAARKYAARINSAGQGLLALINDVLDFSKLEEGAIVLDAHPCAIADVVEDVVGLLSVQADAKSLALAVQIAPDCPSWVELDELRLRQVLQNLIGNAVKFTARGAVTVLLTTLADSRLRVEVRDTGPGMSPDQQARLFERFAQADASITRKYGGSGLGLSICRELVGLMGGEIGVDSTPGQGSTFWFEIDARACPAPATTTIDSDDDIAPLQGVRLLVVDDHEHNRALVSALLSPLGVEVVQASGGAEALETCLTTPFDLVLMDVQMPGMDGRLATAGIRASCELNARTPIIALTAMSSTTGMAELFAAGMNDIVTKPIDPAGLVSAIGAWAGRSEDVRVSGAPIARVWPG